MQHPATPRDAYAELSGVARLVGQVFGVIYPHDLGVAKVPQLLAHAGMFHNGRRVKNEEVRPAIDELVKAGLAQRAIRSGIGTTAAGYWAARLTVEAHRNGYLDAILAAFDKIRPDYTWHYEPRRPHMLLRCNAIAGRFDNIDTLRVSDAPWRFLVTPAMEHIWPNLPPRYLAPALRECLAEALETAAPPEPIIEIALSRAPDPLANAAEIALIRIMQGRFDEALAVFDALPAEAHETKQVKADRAATQALIETLRGNDAEALAFINDAVAAEKLGTRKRNVFPSARAFTLSLLSLVRLDTPAATASLEHLIHVAEQQQIHPNLVLFVKDALAVRSSPKVHHGYASDQATWYSVLCGFTACWRDQLDRYQDAAQSDALLAYVKRATANGYRWAAAEGCAVINRAGSVIERRDHDPAAYGEQAAKAHEALGTLSLTSLTQPIQPWEYSLKALEQFAFEASSKSAKKGGPPAPQKRRLVWEITARHGVVSAQPREQRANKNGTWSRGRAVSLKRLDADAEHMDFLIEQDKRAAAAIEGQPYGWGRRTAGFEVGAEALYELAGHPHLVNEDGESVEVVRHAPELLLNDEADGMLCARIEPYANGWSDHVATMTSDRRVQVTHFNRAHKRLLEIIPEEGLRLPAAAKARLLEAVSALASEVRIQSGIEGGANAVREVAADAQPWVRLLPAGAGLSASVLVEPVPESGAYLTPGQGGATVFANRDGEALQARRDLDAERMAMEALIGACPMLALSADVSDALYFPDPADCLELLDQLQAAGARCLWPEEEPFRIVARADAAQLRLSVKSAAEWFSASGELDVDEERVLDLERLFQLLEHNPQSRFLALGDGQFISLSESFRRQLDDLHSLSTATKNGARRIHTLAALALEDLVEHSQLDSDKAWQKQRDQLSDAQAFEPELPSTLQAELRPYQHEGFCWLARLSRWGVGACLADDMGLGKTVQTLALFLHRAPGGPALVVAPTSVAANWITEARRFAPTLNIVHYTGPPDERGALLQQLAPFDLVVVTYGLLHNDIDALGAVTWHSVVLDEAQAIKNAATRRARAALSLNADFRIVTTGTPIQNNLMDLHSLFSFINPGMLGSAAQFRRSFVLPIERDGNTAARARLRRLIAPFVLRRLKTEVLDDLPPRTEITLHVELSAAEAALYEALRRRAVEDLETAAEDIPDPGQRHLQVLAHLTRLRLACCNPGLVQEAGAPESSKLSTFAETLTELLESRHKVLVFSQFVKHLKLIEAYLIDAGISYQYLDGQTPARARSQRITAFQSGEGDVFLISLKAGGTGLNLTAADYVIHMDPWWNPAVEDQASDRAHRIGQTRPVTIYRLVTKGTIEEQIVDLHEHKRDLADQLLEGTDSAARLDADELLALLRDPIAN